MTARGRPTLYSPQVGQRIAARLTAGMPMSVICAGEGIDRATIYRWRAQHPDDFCDTSRPGDNTPEEHREIEPAEADFCDTRPAEFLPSIKKTKPADFCDTLIRGISFLDKKEPEPGLSDPPLEDGQYPDLVLIVGPKPARVAAITTATPPAPPPARIDPNSRSVPSHYLRDDSDDHWKRHIGVDGVIGGGTCW